MRTLFATAVAACLAIAASFIPHASAQQSGSSAVPTDAGAAPAKKKTATAKGSSKGSDKGSSKGSSKGSDKGSSKGSDKGSSKGSAKGSS